MRVRALFILLTLAATVPIYASTQPTRTAAPQAPLSVDERHTP